MKTSSVIPKAYLAAFRGLTSAQMKEVIRFALFLRTRPDQPYFWTRKWRSKEQFANRDKRLRRVLGDGSADTLIDLLNS